MSDIFSALTDALRASMPMAAAAAFSWGVLSIVLSPCHLASIPLVVAFASERGGGRRMGALAISAVFASGIMVTIGLVGVLTAALGRMLGDVGPHVNYAVAAVFFILGLHFLGAFPLPWSGTGPTRMRRRGLLAAFIIGLVFGLGVGPCTFAYMAPMLGVTLKVASANWLHGVFLLLVYGIGHCSVIVLAGASIGLAQRYLNWSAVSRGPTMLRKACGLLVILGGMYLVYTSP